MEQLEFSYFCWWEFKVVVPLWKNVTVSCKVKHPFTTQSSVLTDTPNENLCSCKSLWVNMYSGFIVVKTAFSWSMNKHSVLHLYDGVLLSSKKEPTKMHTVWVNFSCIMLDENNQYQKAIYNV